MADDSIAEVGIDQTGSLYVRPSNLSFPYVYRAGMEVGWDAERGRLFSPKPREWSYLDWYRQILAAVAGEYGDHLMLSASTIWAGVPDALRAEIEAPSTEANAEKSVMAATQALAGKLVVITGATSGIGEAGACALASQGARLLIVARDPARGGATLTKLNAIRPGVAHSAIYGDLSVLSEMGRVGREIAERETKIDVLINNAGAMFTKRAVTSDGLERTFALNHMAYFVLTQLLLGSLAAAPRARIVSTASIAHEHARLDFSDLQVERGRIAFANAYPKSKLCNILWTRELARRLEGSSVTANCFHPGFVASRFFDGNLAGAAKLVIGVANRFALSPEKGADTLIYLASSPDVEGQTGGYWSKRKRTEPSAAARNAADGAKLWAESERIAEPILRSPQGDAKMVGGEGLKPPTSWV